MSPFLFASISVPAHTTNPVPFAQRHHASEVSIR